MAALTPEEIGQIIEQFLQTVGTRQYIGARYVPIFGRRGEDSIQWDNSAPYEPLTIVLYQGNSYTSRQFVPVGVDITNQDFWANTGNYNAQIEQYRQDVIDAKTAADNAQADIDTLLPKSDFSAVNTVKKYIDQNTTRVLAFDTVADMQNASNLVDGMTCHTNGFHASGDDGAAYYAISDTGTPNGMDVLECANDLFATLIITEPYVTPRMFGAWGDGTHDDAEPLQHCLDSGKTTKIGAGIFVTTQPLYFTNSIIGNSAPRMNGTEADSVIKADFETSSNYVLNYVSAEVDAIGLCVNDVSIDCASCASGLNYSPQSGRPPIKINNVAVWNHAYIGINLTPAVHTSRAAVMNCISVTGGTEDAVCNINVGSNAADCSITDFILMYCCKGIVTRGGGTRLVQGHIFVGRSDVADIDTYYNNTIAIEGYADIIGANIYLDSAQQALVQRNGVTTISNLFVYHDSFANSATNKNGTQIRTTTDTSSIYIGVMYIGGVRTNYAAISAGNVVIGTLVCRWDALPTAINGYGYGQLPFMLNNLGKQEYDLLPSSNTDKYSLIATIYCGGNGLASVQINRTNLAAIVDVTKNGDTITVAKHAVRGFGDLPVYYDISDKYVNLWTVPYGNVSVKSLLSTNGGTTRVGSICGVNLASMASMTIQTRNNTDGLTQIPLT